MASPPTTSPAILHDSDEELSRTFEQDVMERYGRHFVDLLITSIGRIEAPSQVLDLACGVGFAVFPFLAILPNGSRVIALSENRFDLKAFHKKLDPNLRTVVFPRKEQVKRLPFAPGCFDVAYACLPTVPPFNMRPMIRSALRVLRPGGTFALCLPVGGSFFELAAAVTDSIAALRDTSSAPRQLIAERPTLPEPEALADTIQRTGASEVKVHRAELEIPVEPPLYDDRLASVHLLPLWLGQDPSDDPSLAELLNAAITEPTRVTVRLACLRATRGLQEIEEHTLV